MAQDIVPTTEGPSLEALDARLTQEWDERMDGPAAVKTARKILWRVRTSIPDLAGHRKIIDHAMEVLWDRKRFDLAYRLIEVWRVHMIAILDRDPSIDPFEPRARGSITSARLEFRNKNSELAFAHTQLVRRELVAAAGGRAQLAAVVGCPEPSLLGELLCANLAIAIPAGRVLFRKRPVLRAQLLDPLVEEALQILLTGDLPPKYERAHALAIQTLYAIAERGDPADKRILERLERLDEMLRPRHARGQATNKLRDVAIARFNRDAAAETALAEQASDELVRAGLLRHIEVLSERGWWNR